MSYNDRNRGSAGHPHWQPKGINWSNNNNSSSTTTFRSRTWTKPATCPSNNRNAFVFQEEQYHEERSGESSRHQQQRHFQPNQRPASHENPSTSRPIGRGIQSRSFTESRSNYHQNSYQRGEPSSNHQQGNSWPRPQQSSSTFNSYQQNQNVTYNQYIERAYFIDNPFPNHRDYDRPSNFHDQPNFDSSGSSRNHKPLTSKYYRRLPKNTRTARPGMRNFCSYKTKRTGCAKLNCSKMNLQFVYKIKAVLWHRTKMGLHKKKKKVANKVDRYWRLRSAKFYLRKVHSQYWTKNSSKPRIVTKAVNPWRNEPEFGDRRFINFVTSYVPSSWQDSKHAYFHHLEYELHLVPTNGLEFNSLKTALAESEFQILQMVRLQNLILFGAYLSKKQQLVANSTALTEVVRFFCIKRDKLKHLCKHGLDERHVGHSDCFASAKLADRNKPEGKDIVMVVARVTTIPVKHTRSSNEVYPEYIIQYRDANRVQSFKRF